MDANTVAGLIKLAAYAIVAFNVQSNFINIDQSNTARRVIAHTSALSTAFCLTTDSAPSCSSFTSPHSSPSSLPNARGLRFKTHQTMYNTFTQQRLLLRSNTTIRLPSPRRQKHTRTTDQRAACKRTRLSGKLYAEFLRTCH
jgi:hypothetical protein